MIGVEIYSRRARYDVSRFPLAELMGRQHGPSTRLVETRDRQHGPC